MFYKAGITIISFLIFGAFFVFLLAPHFVDKYEYNSPIATTTSILVEDKVTHLKTPVPLKGIYITSWVAGSPIAMQKIIDLIDRTELNSIVIDVKDYTGRISFLVSDPELKKIGSEERRISDIKELIRVLHSKNIYVIARISSFQDSYLVKIRPDLAVKKKSDGKVWADRNGISWLDPNSKEVWNYLVSIGEEAYSVGFDELNFDYIRFPSDGNMSDISYPFGTGLPKAEVIKNFFSYLRSELGDTGAILSADLFGMTTSNTDDLNIGQILENAFPYMDYIAPMVYPSHYPPTFIGFKNPSEKPYEIIKYAMEKAVIRAEKASTTKYKLRPWLQDFSIGRTDYTPEMVRAQIKATYDVGLDSWLLWNAAGKYSEEALLKN